MWKVVVLVAANASVAATALQHALGGGAGVSGGRFGYLWGCAYSAVPMLILVAMRCPQRGVWRLLRTAFWALCGLDIALAVGATIALLLKGAGMGFGWFLLPVACATRGFSFYALVRYYSRLVAAEDARSSRPDE